MNKVQILDEEIVKLYIAIYRYYSFDMNIGEYERFDQSDQGVVGSGKGEDHQAAAISQTLCL